MDAWGEWGCYDRFAEGPEHLIRAIGHTLLEPDAARIPGYIIEADEPLYSVAARPEDLMPLSAYGPEWRLWRVTDLEDVTCYWTAPGTTFEEISGVWVRRFRLVEEVPREQPCLSGPLTASQKRPPGTLDQGPNAQTSSARQPTLISGNAATHGAMTVGQRRRTTSRTSRSPDARMLRSSPPRWCRTGAAALRLGRRPDSVDTSTCARRAKIRTALRTWSIA
jgi:hypothetical protein